MAKKYQEPTPIEEIDKLAELAKKLGNTKAIKPEYDPGSENHSFKLGTPDVQGLDISSTIDESFGGEEGILEIFRGVYAQAKKGSVPHAAFIMQWYFKGGEGGEGLKEFRIIEEIVE